MELFCLKVLRDILSVYSDMHKIDQADSDQIPGISNESISSLKLPQFEISHQEKYLYDLLSDCPVAIEELSDSLDLSSIELIKTLGSLEIKGLIFKSEDGYCKLH